MLAGEFAVLEAYHQSVVMAVDRFVYATIEEEEKNAITLENFNLVALDWEFANQDVTINTNDSRTHFAEKAMTVALTYVQECGISLGSFHLTIRSELDDQSGVKYGLGSSAAVVTSVIAAILHYYPSTKPSAELIYKLAAITHVKTQGNGSGADVAASSYGGILQYTSFQADWLRNAYTNADRLSDLIDEDWIYFTATPLALPDSIHICIGWTGKPASTGKLVDQIGQLKAIKPDLYEQFLSDSENAINQFLGGIAKEDKALLLNGIRQNRHALSTLGDHANVSIETPSLSTLCDLAERYGGAGKPSGAGGGDCGVAFMPSQEKADALRNAWEQHGIKPLDIQVSSFGAKPLL